MNLKIHHLRKSFAQGATPLQILKDLDFSLATGQVAAIIGESGSGKSTFLSVLAGFERADSGSILWDQDDATAWNEDDWARFRRLNLGFVFQNYHLIPYLTALENVALPLRLNGHPDPEPIAKDFLTRLGLGQRLDHLSSQLSGGECQRVAIVRALIHEPKLLLADEPTGSLDLNTGEQVLDLLFDELRARKQTALIVTHSPEVAKRCDQVFTLREGQLWSRSV